MKIKLGLLYGGKSAEHEVSLLTARAVSQAINFEKYEVYPIYITKTGEWIKGSVLTGPAESVETLKFGEAVSKPNNISSFLPVEGNDDSQLDVIFPLLHGPNGEDGTVQGLLEVLNLPYVGNGVLASAAGMDKVVMKQLFEIAGLSQVPYVHFIRKEWKSNQETLIQKMEESLKWPMFVKPANLGSSVGITKATNREELIKAVELAFKYDRKIIVEQGIKARELEMSVLGNDNPRCSIAGEVLPTKDFYDYEAKYEDGTTNYAIPAVVSADLLERMEDAAIRAFKVLDCSGLVRADFFVTDEEEIIINEVNTMPGFTPISMYPKLWIESGLSYSGLIEELIMLALERYEEKQQLEHSKDGE
ncbi:D-alanine--D-alanine ligase [Psychrobacillus lasiicapitis]|uniref:D-alanine--D-alanine ligase n=1 Tax=Psychrobacillus lasiicapitis TaxID=1636719 RepID=A0A544T5E7_9BACI|nr:D-alanine--D-alanine ligase [Psychrobacillus lasiicapitis]TQR12665.1 D-alanine--D-alanine ligase [Psychrobacillus lasiicapitis]GGA39955.1 D-alanine--D-alanine ligase [Psychrobacillus lasiicapitis]